MFLCQEAAPPPPCLSERKRLWPSPPVNDDDWASERQLRWFLLGFNNYQTERKPQRHSVFDCDGLPLSHRTAFKFETSLVFWKGLRCFDWTPASTCKDGFLAEAGLWVWGPWRRSFFTWQLEGGFPGWTIVTATAEVWQQKIITNEVAIFLFFFCNSPFHLQMLSMAQNKGQCFRSAMLLYKSGGHCNGWNVPSACKLWSLMSA